MSFKTNEMRKRRKKLIIQLIAVGFICLLLLRFDFWTVFDNPSRNNHNKNVNSLVVRPEDRMKYDVESHLRKGAMIDTDKRNNKNLLRGMMADLFGKKEETVTKCEIPYFKNIPLERDIQSMACQRQKPTVRSCQLASQLFGNPSKKQLDSVCSHQKAKEFCKLEQTNSGVNQVICDISSCDDGIHLGTIDTKTADEIWSEVFNKDTLQHTIVKLIENEHVGFCLIRCGGDDQLGDPKHVPSVEGLDSSKTVSQILILPPFVKASKHAMKDNDFINFNFVFIDSVSRSHFHRSLPKSVEIIDKIAMETKSQSNSPIILDYHMVQAVRSRTYESLQTLFAGIINPFEKPFGTQSMPRSRLSVKDLIGPLKDMGYITQWMEDLCPLWEWGIAKDFLVYNKSLSVEKMWDKLRMTLNEVKLDSIGPTLSSCRILHANAHADPFHGPERICYNGKQQHEYLFDYLHLFHQKMNLLNQPYFSFFQSNIAHESSGLRVQYYDGVLSEYIKYAASLDNTLTILLSDHGNAYGEFVNYSPEGRIEMYNPFMYLILPSKVQSFIGSQHLQTLARNQHKLISLLDLHYTLKYLIEKLFYNKTVKNSSVDGVKSKVSEFNQQFNVSNYGLFSLISEARTCSQIPRIMPNLCICAGYDSKSSNYHYNFIIAMYVMGQLNNQIQEQLRKQRTNIKKGTLSGGFGRCYRMVTEKIMNVQRSKDADHDTIKMDLYVKTPGQKQPEIFFIAVSMETSEYGTFHLQNFERTTQYSKYSVCADSGVDLGLCICDLDLGKKNVSREKLKNRSLVEIVQNKNLKVTYDLIEVEGVICLKVIQRSGMHGAIAEAFNGCGTSVTIYLEIAAENLILSPLDEIKLYPGDTTFLVAGVAMDTDKAWDWDIEVNVQI